jgi:hypothetical protein
VLHSTFYFGEEIQILNALPESLDIASSCKFNVFLSFRTTHPTQVTVQKAIICFHDAYTTPGSRVSWHCVASFQKMGRPSLEN